MSLIFRKQDFEQLNYRLVFINLTSGTECKDPHNVELCEINEENLKLRVPVTSCNTGHSLMVLFFKGEKTKIPQYLSQDGKGKTVYFAVTGKILDKQIDEDNKSVGEISFKFTQFENDKWERILNEIKSRQEDVNATIGKIKVNE